jgi:hypothetical protein
VREEVPFDLVLVDGSHAYDACAATSVGSGEKEAA